MTQSSPGSGQRYEQLDSLRGLAALSVVFSHFMQLRPAGSESTWWYYLLTWTPLVALQSGHEAVVLFYVLSGFVLSLPFWRGPVELRGFYARRICRIGIPYWVALVPAFGLMMLCARGPIPELGEWFNGRWTAPPTSGEVLAHIGLIGTFVSGAYNPALWSLVIEMRMSLLFPLLIAVFGRLRWPWALALSAMVSTAGAAGEKVFGWGAADSWSLTARFSSAFVAGILVGRHQAELVAWCRDLGTRRRWSLLALALLCYTWPGAVLPGVRWLHIGLLNEWIVTLGSCLLIVLALTPGRFERLLRREPQRFLGVTSYSLYLYHGLIMLALCHLLYGRWPLWAILMLSLAVSLLAAHLSYQWVEVRSIAWGRALSRRLAQRR